VASSRVGSYILPFNLNVVGFVGVVDVVGKFPD